MNPECGFIRRVHRGPHGREAPYSVFVPYGYEDDRQWPLIVFLHGSGETGVDGVKPTGVGIGPAIRRNEHGFPFFTVFPQSQRGTWQAGSQDAETALAILEEVRVLFRIDPGRIHLTGISMGGFGTWGIAASHPELWASIVPVCGGGDPASAGCISHIPCWAFHGEADNVVPVEQSRRMVAALRSAGGQLRYTEYEGVGHNSWDPAYATPELFEWIADNSR
jgi:predicted peptidase